MRKYPVITLLTAFILAFIFITGCKRSNDVVTPIDNPVIVDDAVQVTANVSGIVLDETNDPVQGAIVTSGTVSAVTDVFGTFSFRNILLSKENGSVTVTKTGYFTGVRSFKTTAGKDHMVKIQLMQKQLSGSITASAGGTINSNGGASINFPVDAFVTGSGAAYSGTVNVYSRWIDPTANNLPLIIPGDLRGIAINGAENILQTYGMVGAEIEDASGNTLKIAPGKTALVTFPVPAILNGAAPATIALWHFDNTTARWKEEGTATKSGNSYTASVDKFSFWNCDRGISNYINLDYTLINAATNSPMVGAVTRIRIVSSNFYASGITNNSGFVSGLVPKNESLVLEVMSSSCPEPFFTRNIGPFSSNTSLGNIDVTIPATMYINFTGTIVNCSAAPVTNGYLSLCGLAGNSGFANTDASGNFSFTILNCTNATLPYSFMGVDNTTSQQSAIGTGIAMTGIENLGTITACSTPATTDIYIAGFEPYNTTNGNNKATVWKNTTATHLSDGTRNGLGYGVYVSGNDVYVCGREQDNTSGFSIARVWKNGTVLYNLSDGTGYAAANAIFVSGSDVYVTGSLGTVGKVWKNGVATNLAGTGSVHGNAITVVGTDVYVAGAENLSGRLWKNGSVLFSMALTGEFTSVFVSGSDVYAAGSEYNGSKNIAKYWKNGVATILDNGPTESHAIGICVAGTDVYVTGNVTNPTGFFTVAKIWKNGVATDLTNGSHFGGAVSVVVKGSDVYVLGSDQSASGTSIVIVWKNGFPTNITDGSIDAVPEAFFIK